METLSDLKQSMLFLFDFRMGVISGRYPKILQDLHPNVQVSETVERGHGANGVERAIARFSMASRSLPANGTVACCQHVTYE
jgi:hypothetical protein